MAYDDALFQLGMDLTRSSPAQTEETGDSTRTERTRDDFVSERHVDTHLESEAPDLSSYNDERQDFFIERDGVRYAGNHLIIDLFGAKGIDSLDCVEKALRRCVTEAGATLLHFHLHHFTPNGGVSGVAVLSESHISIHSWPEADYAALDVFMCGDARPHVCIDILREEFNATDVVVKTHRRGEELDLMAWKAAAGTKQAKAA